MTATQLIERLLDEGLTPEQLVRRLLEEDEPAPVWLGEASVHLPHGGKVWVAYYTGLEPGQQISRSTGLTDYAQALARAKQWEAQARAQRAAQGARKPGPTLRVRRLAGITHPGPMSHSEIARRLGMSERGVRAAEKRALRKMAKDPELWQFWTRYLSGEL